MITDYTGALLTGDLIADIQMARTNKNPWCCVEEIHIFKAFPSNCISYKPVNFHVTHSIFQVYIANRINTCYYTGTAINTVTF